MLNLKVAAVKRDDGRNTEAPHPALSSFGEEREKRSLTCISTVRAKEGAGHERTIIGKEKQHGLATFFRRAEPLNRLRLSQHVIDCLNRQTARLME